MSELGPEAETEGKVDGKKKTSDDSHSCREET